jgi:hypothetical protein
MKEKHRVPPYGIFLLVLLPMLLCYLLPGYGADHKSISFYWSFLKCNSRGEISPLDTQCKFLAPEENFFKIYLRADAGVYLYLFHFSYEKELNLLFPDSVYLGSSIYPADREYYIPGAEDWFALDSRPDNHRMEGRIEKFYLLASSSRLEGLERLTRQFLVSRTADRKQQVINRILNIKNKASSFAAPVENPVMITTRFRSGEESLVYRVEAEELYARIIRLEY